MAALRTDARWHAVVQYRTGTETPKNFEIYLEEIGDIHERALGHSLNRQD